MILWELPPSPNNLKVYMALRYKGLDFEVRFVDPRDRAAVREASGQDLTPVLEDKGIVLPDSEAIIRYLDANYRERPLWPPDKQGQRACEAWKATTDRRLAKPWMPVFFHAVGFADSHEDSDVAAYSEALRWLDEELGEGARPALDELRAVEWACYGLPGPRLLARVPLLARVAEMFAVDAAAVPRVAELCARWDAYCGAPE